MNNTTRTFSIERNGRAFQCTSEVKGNQIIRQIIYVEGLGSRADAFTYGKTRHSASAMKLAAEQIALDLIKNSLHVDNSM